jgi:hypothetical protein
VKHIKTVVEYSYDYETDAPDFDWGNEIENRRERKRFELGELQNLILKVEAKALGESGVDYLGQVFVKAKTWEQDLIDTAIPHDMKNNACTELRDNILHKYQIIRNALGAA